jgi:Uma2 family endonuclease
VVRALDGTCQHDPSRPDRAGLRLDVQLAAILHPYGRAAGLTGLGPFNLGVADDYRVPDRGFTATPPDEVFVPTAAVVVEILSPGDESYEKLGFSAERGVRSVIIVEGAENRVRIFQLVDGQVVDGQVVDGQVVEADRCAVLGISASDLTAAIDWP